jgi:hypothetical protein
MAGSFLFSRGLRITAAVCLLLGIVLPLPLFPACFFKTITGISCPGCGLTRAICAISHGRIADAWHWHPFFYFLWRGAVHYFLSDACFLYAGQPVTYVPMQSGQRQVGLTAGHCHDPVLALAYVHSLHGVKLCLHKKKKKLVVLFKSIYHESLAL